MSEGLSFHELSAESLGVRWGHELYVAGRVPAGPRAAVVGSRAAHVRFAECVPPLVEGLASAGHALVSGGAVGIDAVSHRAALERGVPQIAVLPGPPDALYPPDHAPLFAAIVRAGGAVICAQRPGAAFSRGIFASRNALVVGLSSVVIAVQAGLRSGTRGTLALALRRGRTVAGLVGTPGVAWALERGACSLGSPQEATTLAARTRALCLGEPSGDALAWPAALAPLVVALRRNRTVSLDDFEDPVAAAATLVEAEAGGWITQVGPGCYVRARALPTATSSRALVNPGERRNAGDKPGVEAGAETR